MSNQFVKGDQIVWEFWDYRDSNKKGAKQIKNAEFERLIKHDKGHTGPQKAYIVMDHNLSIRQAPVSELTIRGLNETN